MYLPQHFATSDRGHALRLMAEHPLALLVGPDAAGESFGTHVPLIAEPTDGGFMLEGHMARANPHWSWLSRQHSLMVVFGGPSGYVGPATTTA